MSVRGTWPGAGTGRGDRARLPSTPPCRYLRRMRRLAVAALCLGLASPCRAALRAQEAGSYLALRIDEAVLPLADRVTDGDGTTYLVQFDRMVLSLRAGNRFRAAVRFRRTLTTGDGRAGQRQAPIQSMTVTGRYEVTGKAIRFIADESKDLQGVRMLDGAIEGPRRIAVPFDYRNGAVERRRVLRLEWRGDIL